MGGHFYGNIGKCLELLDRQEQALKCYYYSISILFEEDNSNSKLNIGYASSWIYYLLKKNEEKFNALYFLKLSINTWELSSPPRAEKMKKEWRSFKFDKDSKKEVDKLPDWKIKNYCRDFVKSKLTE